MKRLFSLLTIITIILLSNCSRMTKKDNPVIGIWTATTAMTKGNLPLLMKSEWIFNDAHLGRYQVIESGAITTKTDFEWTEKDGIYIISYFGLERADEKAILKETSEGNLLEDIDGNILAMRD